MVCFLYVTFFYSRRLSKYCNFWDECYCVPPNKEQGLSSKLYFFLPVWSTPTQHHSKRQRMKTKNFPLKRSSRGWEWGVHFQFICTWCSGLDGYGLFVLQYIKPAIKNKFP